MSFYFVENDKFFILMKRCDLDFWIRKIIFLLLWDMVKNREVVRWGGWRFKIGNVYVDYSRGDRFECF